MDIQEVYRPEVPYNERNRKYYAAKYLMLFRTYKDYLIREYRQTGKSFGAEWNYVDDALVRYFKRLCDR